MLSIPVEFVDDDEFQALEVAIASAEAGALAQQLDGHEQPFLPLKRCKSGMEKEPASTMAAQAAEKSLDFRITQIDTNGGAECSFAVVNSHTKEEERPSDNRVTLSDNDELQGHTCTTTRRLPSWPRHSYTVQKGAGIVALNYDMQPMVSLPQPDEVGAPQFPNVAENLPWGLAPSTRQVATRRKLPSLRYRGQIVYSRTVSDAEAAASELSKLLDCKKVAGGGGIVPLGFDTEWKVLFTRGAERRKVGVVQLCIDSNHCNVFQIVHSGVPVVLRTMLEDPYILKVGLGAYEDANKLRTDYNINVRGVQDLNCLANKKLKGPNKTGSFGNWSLSSLAVDLIGKKVDKTQSIRMGDWEVDPLSMAQLQYAATDAFASLYLFQVLSSFPDVSTNGVDTR